MNLQNVTLATCIRTKIIEAGFSVTETVIENDRAFFSQDAATFPFKECVGYTSECEFLPVRVSVETMNGSPQVRITHPENLYRGNDRICSKVNEDSSTELMGRFAEEVHGHLLGVKTRRTRAAAHLHRLKHMENVLPDREADWPLMKAWAIYQGPERWCVESSLNKLENVPESGVIEVRSVLEKYSGPQEEMSERRDELRDFLEELKFSRAVLAAPLPPLPKIPRKFRASVKLFEGFTW